MMSSIQELDRLRIPFEDINEATNNFNDENVIGMGCFGKVYKGKLSRRDGFVSVQRFDQKFDASSGHWLDDPNVMFLSRFNHENIVSFVGFCVANHETIFVHEFLTQESLEKHLSSAKLKWINRVQICLAVARGLEYLHNGQEGCIGTIHRDMKSANILLDENWQPKIANLRLPKTGLNQTSSDPMLNQCGTFGYIDPIYFQTATLTKESDIYSFGVVLFEVLCGRPAVQPDVDIKGVLGPVARHHCEEGTITKIIDPILLKQMNPKSFNAFSAIAYRCLEDNRSKRPTIIEIVEMLEKVLLLQEESEKALTLRQIKEHLKFPLQEIHPFTHDFHAHHRNVWEKYLEHWKISFEKIRSATNNFDSNLIGLGGFGGVYKANLVHFDVRKYARENKYYQFPEVELHGYPTRESQVAIKRLDTESGQGKSEFLQEIEVLSRINHENLVSLLGFCDENNEMILIYEYASNGSLDKCIQNIHQGVNNSTWQKRLQICLDMAHGLNFLHSLNLIHRDIKSANILLSYNWKGMIGDFGLSKISKRGDEAFKTGWVGTLGYVDPKYAREGVLSKQSDIYSLGVVLLEVLCGRLAILPRFGDDPEFIVHMARRHFKQNQMIDIIDHHLRKELDNCSTTQENEKLLGSIDIFIKTINECIHSTETQTQLMMEKVVIELKRAFIIHSIGVEALSLQEINIATNYFSEECVIGMGASGKVYSAELFLDKKTKVFAVKRLNRVGSYVEGAFLEEVRMLSRYIHENIIPLRGFCEEGNEKIIILEHAINGSLDKHLDDSTLTWGLRLKISIGIAKGLLHIHTFDDAQHTLHGDIKSSHILLDEDWKATISNLIIPKANYGTLAYLDPLHSSGGLTKESDVYSFGVVLFEILSGRLAVEEVEKYWQHELQNIINVEAASDARDQANENEQVVFLAEVAARCFKDHKLEALIFDGIKEQTDKESIDVFSDIAYQCLHKDKDERPIMARVLDALENASKIHDEWKSKQRLPKDYEKIIKISGDHTKKELYSLSSSGILLEREKVESLRAELTEESRKRKEEWEQEERRREEERCTQEEESRVQAKRFKKYEEDFVVKRQ